MFTVGKVLAKKRVSLNISQNELAKYLGYTSPQFVSNWERGRCSPPLKDLKKISKKLRFSKKEISKIFMDQFSKELKQVLS